LKRPFAKIVLAVIAVVFVFALISFLRENWSASGAPGPLERFLARIALSHSRNSEADVKNPLQPTPENLEAGHAIYDKQCAFCHGEDGKGQGASGPQFYPPVPPLVPQSEREKMTEGQIQYVVTNGVRYTAMPSFAKQLTPDEIWKVTLWVGKLQKQ
jgi:mono/diheme cytochrome c family protein